MTWGQRDESIEARLKNAKTRREIALAELQRNKRGLAGSAAATLLGAVVTVAGFALMFLIGAGAALLVLSLLGVISTLGGLAGLSYFRTTVGASREKMANRQAEWDSVNAEAARR